MTLYGFYGITHGWARVLTVAPADLAVCWWGDMELMPHLWGLLRLPGFRATLAFGDGPIRDDDRKRLAERLHCAVAGLFTPVVGSAPGSA